MSSSVGNSANAANVSSNAAETLTIGGSTTIFPVSNAAIGAFEAEYPGVVVQLVQGGSGAGMEGVIIGALDIGAASAYPVFSSYQSSAAGMNPPVNLVGTEIGGSGVVAIVNGPNAATGVTTPGAGLLTDGAEYCTGITSSAMNAIYQSGTFGILKGGCAAAGTNGFLTWPQVCAVGTVLPSGVTELCSTAGAEGTAYFGPYFTYSRSDVPSGTQDTFGEWMGFSGTATGTTDFGTSETGETAAVGNPGVLAGVQSCSNAGALGCIGFVDYGFAAGGSSNTAQAVSVPALATSVASKDTTLPTLVAPVTCDTITSVSTTAPINCYATLSHLSTKAIDSYMKNALSGAGPQFPDNTAVTNPLNPGTNGGNDPLSRTFWYVTNGAPTPVEQDWIQFMINPGQNALFTSAGYYPVYSFKTG